MNFRETIRQAEILERQFDLASPLRRMQMRGEVSRCILDFRLLNYPVPSGLRRVEAAIESETYEDMFENMPV